MNRNAAADALLIESARQGNLHGLRRALENGADINTRDEKGRTPLMCAAMTRNSNAIDLLLKYGANPLARNAAGQTVLEWAMPVYTAVQREIFGHALDGVNTDAGTRESLRCAHILSSLQKADKAARERQLDFSTPVKKNLRPLRPLHLKK